MPDLEHDSAPLGEYVLVPRQPTDRMMLVGGFSFAGRVPNKQVYPEVHKVWDAMLAAAPTLSPTVSQPIEAQPIHALPMPKYDFQGNEPTPSQPGTGEGVEQLKLANERWRQNSTDTWAAMTAMRNSISERIPMPSLEGDLLQGPESSVFCAAVAEAVLSYVDDAEARLSAVEGALKTMTGHVEQLVELLDIIKEHWIDYDHVYSIAVHEAREALTTITGGENER